MGISTLPGLVWLSISNVVSWSAYMIRALNNSPGRKRLGVENVESDHQEGSEHLAQWLSGYDSMNGLTTEYGIRPL